MFVCLKKGATENSTGEEEDYVLKVNISFLRWNVMMVWETSVNASWNKASPIYWKKKQHYVCILVLTKLEKYSWLLGQAKPYYAAKPAGIVAIT